MKTIRLTDQKREKLKKLQRSTKDNRVFKKIATILGLDLGINYLSLANMLSLDETTIRRYEKQFLTEEFTNFIKNNYKFYKGKLSEFQLKRLREEMINNLYQTTSQVVVWIEEQYGIKYHNQGVIALLHKLGFVYKKTKLIPAKANKEKQEQFVKKFEQLHSNLKDDEVIYFGDATHPQHNTQIANGWIIKGKEKEIKSNTGRTRINLNGVLNPDTKEIIIREDKTINAQSTIELYKEIENKNPDKRKIFIIIDNARYYRCKLLDKYLENSKIEQIFLPPYSPNLNLIERLWGFMKRKVIYNKYYEKSTEFRLEIFSFFDNIITQVSQFLTH